MKQFGLPQSHFYRLALFCAFVFLFAWSLENLEERAIDSYGSATRGEKLGPRQWKWDLSLFPEGSYYLSAGRTRGLCTIEIDSKLADTTRSSIPGIQQQLTLGESVTIQKGDTRKISLSCEQAAGFPIGLMDTPALLPSYTGHALHLVRVLLHLILGPFACLFLLLSSLPRLLDKTRSGGSFRPHVNHSIAVFALFGLLYTISYARIPRLFLDNYWAGTLHVCLRTMYSLAFIEVVFSLSKRIHSVTLLYFGLIVMDLTIAIGWRSEPSTFNSIYTMQYPLYALTTFIAYVHLYRSKEQSASKDWLLLLTGLWSITQVVDFVSLYLQKPTFKAPVVAVLLTLGVEIVRQRDSVLTAKIEDVSKRLIAAIKKKGSLFAILTDVAELLGKETSFTRRSVYLDSFCIGQTSKPFNHYKRIMEFGYQKETSDDQEIDIHNERGNLMRLAMESGKVYSGSGPDGSCFAIVPIGKMGCINLSDGHRSIPSKVFESISVIERLRAPLATLEQRLESTLEGKNSFLDRIKASRGFGTFKIELGAIFIDIVDYSQKVSRYKALSSGDDPFGAFVVGKYFPALTRAIAEFAQLSDTEGDEAFFVVIEEFSPEHISIEEATAQCCQKISQFAVNEGALLCSEEGFAPIQFRIGACTGNASLVCDERRVRTSGESINFASRMMMLAANGGLMLSPGIARFISEPGFTKGKPREFLEKKDMVIAQPVHFTPVKSKAS